MGERRGETQKTKGRFWDRKSGRDRSRERERESGSAAAAAAASSQPRQAAAAASSKHQAAQIWYPLQHCGRRCVVELVTRV